MPITRKQYELGIDAAIERRMRELHHFLEEHKEEAFTLLELADTLGAWSEEQVRIRREFGAQFPLPDVLTRAADTLIYLRAVESREVRGEVYYAWAGPLEL